MINDKNLKQKGGEQSTNFQGQTVNVYQGITYTDAKEIALDVFKTNFIHLKNEAAQIAAERAEEITENILSKLNEKTPERLQEFQQPSMQDALFTAQKEYAKSGDKDLGDLLVDIIVDRAGVTKRNMLQIVLDESLLIAPKLTIEQLDTLTLNFLLVRTRRMNIRNYEDFKNYLTNFILPFTDNLTSEHEHYNYLEYLRCGQIRVGDYGKLENNLRETYKGVFAKGFTEEEFKEEFENIAPLTPLLIPCFHDKAKLQIGVFDDETLKQRMDELSMDDATKTKLQAFFEKTTMTGNEIKDMLIQFDNRMEKVFTTWSNSSFKKFELSHVGIAIGHANYRRKTNETMNLSKWIK